MVNCAWLHHLLMEAAANLNDWNKENYKDAD